MRHGIVPALIFFALAAAGLMAARDMLTSRAAVAEAPAATETSQPTAPTSSPLGRSALLHKERDGHYWTTAVVNGMPTRFIVDTGASVVALTRHDAERIGIDVNALPRTAQISTANGKVKAGVAMLDTISIDSVEVTHVQAVVLDDGLEQSLLGMSFLNKLHEWNATSDAMVIRQ